MTRAIVVPTNPTYDALIVEINRSDALAGLLEDVLLKLADQPDAPYQVYALALMASHVSDHHQRILEKAQALHHQAYNQEQRRPKRGAR